MAKTKRKQAKPVSKALARVPKKKLVAKRPANKRVETTSPIEQLERVSLATRTLLAEQVEIGELGMVEVKLTDLEERVLDEPAPVDEILIKPTGQIYLSHPTYARWFNRAFGRLGWGLQPCAMPKATPSDDGKRVTVVQPYVLYIHGKPCRFAYGEHEYFTNNKEQTYGDALEATRANGLRRCAKAMGVGLELWDKQFGLRFQRNNCIKVKVRGKKWDRTKREEVDGEVWLWRRRVDDPFDGEGAQAPQKREAPKPVETPAQHANEDKKISDEARQRLWRAARSHNRSEDEVAKYLLAKFKVRSSADILTRDYNTIVRALEHPGPLLERETGEEG